MGFVQIFHFTLAHVIAGMQKLKHKQKILFIFIFMRLHYTNSGCYRSLLLTDCLQFALIAQPAQKLDHKFYSFLRKVIKQMLFAENICSAVGLTCLFKWWNRHFQKWVEKKKTINTLSAAPFFAGEAGAEKMHFLMAKCCTQNQIITTANVKSTSLC